MAFILFCFSFPFFTFLSFLDFIQRTIVVIFLIGRKVWIQHTCGLIPTFSLTPLSSQLTARCKICHAHVYLRWHLALHVCFSPLCTYWPFHCSHPGVAHIGVTDSESKLKTAVGIKGQRFIRIIHSNTINFSWSGGQGRVSAREKEESKGFSIYSLSPI